MHSHSNKTTKDVSNKMANAPQHARYIPNDPMPAQQGSIPTMPPKRLKPT